MYFILVSGLPLSVLAADTNVSKTNSVQASKAVDWNEYTLALGSLEGVELIYHCH